MTERTKKIQSIARILCDCLSRIIDDSGSGQPNPDYWQGQLRVMQMEIARLKDEISKEKQWRQAIENQGDFQTLWGPISNEMPTD